MGPMRALSPREEEPQISDTSTSGTTNSFNEATKIRPNLGLAEGGGSDYRHALTSEGRKWALEALEQSQYVGPAPIPMAEFAKQVTRQSVANERVTPNQLADALSLSSGQA